LCILPPTRDVPIATRRTRGFFCLTSYMRRPYCHWEDCFFLSYLEEEMSMRPLEGMFFRLTSKKRCPHCRKEDWFFFFGLCSKNYVPISARKTGFFFFFFGLAPARQVHIAARRTRAFVLHPRKGIPIAAGRTDFFLSYLLKETSLLSLAGLVFCLTSKKRSPYWL
jgi:hypothetical protein